MVYATIPDGEANRFWASLGTQHGYASAEEMEANARLIAAAPDLLQVLKAMVASAQESPCGFPGIPLHAALAVIARAEGCADG